MPSYQERLTANNLKIDEITALANTLPDADEINDKLDEQDTIIANLQSALDEKAGVTGGTPNIFVQTTEPDTKKGIWLKKNAEPEHYTYDEEVFIGGEWMADGTKANIPYTFTAGAATAIGTDIYLFGGTGGRTTAYKYNTLTNTYTQLTNIPFQFSYSSVVAVGTNIYLISGTNNYKYNTLTDTYIQCTDIPYTYGYSGVVAVGTDIYILGSTTSSYNNYNYKYNTLTDTYTRMTNIPYSFSYGQAVAIGTDIYLLGGNFSATFVYKYNTLTDTYSYTTDIPYSFTYGSATVLSSNIYIFGGEGNDNKVKAYEYDTLVDTWTQLTDIPYNFNSGASVSVGSNIYLLGGSFYSNKVQVYIVESKTYQQDNLVVISQGKYNSVGYEIELYNNMKDVTSPKYAFADAWYYTTQGGLETDIPTYYGNGTSWINIKNPPSNS
jgi:hypothetical protein